MRSPVAEDEMAPAETLVDDDARGKDDGADPSLPGNGVDIEVDQPEEGTVTYLPQSNLREQAHTGREERSVGIDISRGDGPDVVQLRHRRKS